MTVNTYRPRMLLVLLAAAVLAAGLLAPVGAKPAWAADPSFRPLQPLPVGSTPTTVTNADFNGDGTMDLAAQNAGSNTVSVLLGNGDDTFQQKQDFAVGTSPTSVISADFNADRVADLAVANQGSNTVSVLLGNGDGTFQAKTDFAVGRGSSSVISADFNADRVADLAVANQNSDDVSVLLGNGNGTFQSAQNFTISPPCTSDPCLLFPTAAPNQVIAADFNGDSKADLATANVGRRDPFFGTFNNPGGVSVLLGKGDGTFQTPKEVMRLTSDSVYSITAAHLDAGSSVDLVAAKYNANVVSVLKGNGDSTFQAAQSFGVGSNPSAVTTADLDGDTKADDLAVANFSSDNVSVLFNNDSGGFQAAQNFPAGDGPAFVIGVDLNADSLADLAVANQESDNVSVLLNTPATSAPTAMNDSYNTNQDMTLNQPAPGVLANDRDPDGDSLTAMQVTGPANGQLRLSADGSFTYTPNTGFSGSDSFTYKATDGSADSNTATVRITVNSANDAPTCENVAIVTAEDTQGSVAAECSDVDGDPLTYAIVDQPADGTASVVDGNLKYDPEDDFNGPDSFTYRASDGTANSAAATVDVTVNAVNDAPVADDQSISTDEDVAKDITLSASDVEGGNLTYEVVDGPAHGTLSGSGANLTYTPNDDYFGDDSFAFKANDGTTDSNTATVTITVSDTTAPTVFSVNPSNLTGVLTTTDITVTFSEKMKGDTLNNNTVKLVKPGRKTTSIPVTMAQTTDGSGRTVLTLNPFGSTKQKLSATTTYQLTIEGAGDTDVLAVKDLAGNELVNDYVSSFTTARK
jgi:VCBS repeat-containing protein